MEATPVDVPFDLDPFTRAYLQCAAWSSTIAETCDECRSKGPARDCGCRDDAPLDDFLNDGSAEWAPETIEAARAECRDFQLANWSHMRGLDVEQCGHDFWLTRNGHGAGFWDRGYGARGDLLSARCKPYGSAYLYLGEDGRIYCD